MLVSHMRNQQIRNGVYSVASSIGVILNLPRSECLKNKYVLPWLICIKPRFSLIELECGYAPCFVCPVVSSFSWACFVC